MSCLFSFFLCSRINCPVPSSLSGGLIPLVRASIGVSRSSRRREREEGFLLLLLQHFAGKYTVNFKKCKLENWIPVNFETFLSKLSCGFFLQCTLQQKIDLQCMGRVGGIARHTLNFLRSRRCSSCCCCCCCYTEFGKTRQDWKKGTYLEFHMKHTTNDAI